MYLNLCAHSATHGYRAATPASAQYLDRATACRGREPFTCALVGNIGDNLTGGMAFAVSSFVFGFRSARTP
jgi:hypothetical protein